MTSFIGSNRERLLVAVMAIDVVNVLNTVFRTRGLSFTLDWMGKNPVLLVSRPRVDPELFMQACFRTKKYLTLVPRHPDLQSAVVDLVDRLSKLDAKLVLVTQKDRNQKRWAKLQVHVAGSRGYALNVLEVPRGTKRVETEFNLPGE